MNTKYSKVARTPEDMIRDLQSENEYLIGQLILLEECCVCQKVNYECESYGGCFIPITDGRLLGRSIADKVLTKRKVNAKIKKD